MREITSTLSNLGASRAIEEYMTDSGNIMRRGVKELARICHSVSVYRGWWGDDGKRVTRNLGELLALIHSEISEALEGARKDLPSDHLPDFTMLEEEVADAFVRLGDFAYAAGLRIDAALHAKIQFNLTRHDHDPKVRAEGGKQF